MSKVDIITPQIKIKRINVKGGIDREIIIRERLRKYKIHFLGGQLF